MRDETREWLEYLFSFAVAFGAIAGWLGQGEGRETLLSITQGAGIATLMAFCLSAAVLAGERLEERGASKKRFQPAANILLWPVV